MMHVYLLTCLSTRAFPHTLLACSTPLNRPRPSPPRAWPRCTRPRPWTGRPSPSRYVCTAALDWACLDLRLFSRTKWWTDAHFPTSPHQVQYPRLESEVRSDMWTLRTLATLVGTLFNDWDYAWLCPEFEESIVRLCDWGSGGFQDGGRGRRRADLLDPPTPPP